MWKYFVWPVVATLLIASQAFTSCDSGFYIGGCLYGRIFVLVWLSASFVVYYYLCKIYRKFINGLALWKGILLLLATQIFSLVTLAPIIVPLVFVIIGLWGWLGKII